MFNVYVFEVGTRLGVFKTQPRATFPAILFVSKKKVRNLKNFNWIAWFVVIGTKIDVINHRENASYLKLV